MAVKISKAEDKLIERNTGFRVFLENIKNFAFLFYSLTLALCLIIMTWSTFTINVQKKKQIEIERKIELQTVYMGVLSNDYKNMKREYEKLQEKIK